MTTTPTYPKYPKIHIRLLGEDGNAYAILGRVTREMKRNGLADQVDAFRKEATSHDYTHLLVTVMRWFSTDEADLDYEGEEYEPNTCSLCDEDLYECECEA